MNAAFDPRQANGRSANPFDDAGDGFEAEGFDADSFESDGLEASEVAGQAAQFDWGASSYTVKTYLKQIFIKLKVRSRSAMVDRCSSWINDATAAFARPPR